MNGKISVIVPIYNVENYLDKCIESILNQTYSNLEVILVNDGSPDNCGGICDNYASTDDRIKVVHKKNGGLSDARNAGMSYATGEYISFIDSDDYIHLTFYETLINLMVKHNADIVQCGYEMVYEDKGSTIRKREETPKESIYSGKNNILNNLYNNNYGKTVVVWNKLFKSNLFEEVYFPKGKLHEDEMTTYQILHQAEKFVITEKNLYYYLQRKSSIMGQGFNIDSLTLIEAYYNQIRFYKQNNLFELEKKATSRLEHLVRGSMNRVIINNLESKKNVLNYLIMYYRKNLNLFSLFPSSTKNKIVRKFFQYSPIFLIRWSYEFLNLRRRKLKI
ncbi:glycosyltransferase [Niallia circulans]|jgi:glycosyltransferase involved in cell wall biosynthesis|uniref:glycosyltransferase family 2 protein n=1 Tax=Niallia circulans TaxID=1397 RepID=UPI00148FFDCE|nr:glycosyltransferase [Niallia circulans]QJX64180.1 glycosyltransferase [Niallia circulans]